MSTDKTPQASAPEGLHPRTADLVQRFAAALAQKLAAAERKYGYSDGWAEPDWMDECRAKLIEHVAKGDPRDVGAYCAFLWHHGQPTAVATKAQQASVLSWSTMESCPVATEVLLWNQETEEMFFGYRPEDAPTPEAVVASGLPTAAYADAWMPKPREPESETHDSEAHPPRLSIAPQPQEKQP